MNCFMLDIETTGVCLEKDVVLEVAGGVADLSAPVYSPVRDEFRILVYPTVPMTVSLHVLAMHSNLWKELESYAKDMKTKEVVKVNERFFVVRREKLYSLFSSFAGPISKIFWPGKSRVPLGGKNTDFDINFLKKVDPRFNNFFMHRKFDPGILWLSDKDEFVPDTQGCIDRMKEYWPDMPLGTLHGAVYDNRVAAYLLRAGLRRLGVFKDVNR